MVGLEDMVSLIGLGGSGCLDGSGCAGREVRGLISKTKSEL